MSEWNLPMWRLPRIRYGDFPAVKVAMIAGKLPLIFQKEIILIARARRDPPRKPERAG